MIVRANVFGAALSVVMVLLSLSAPSMAETTLSGQGQNPEFDLGMVAAQSNDWRNALQHFTEANRTRPDHSYVLYNLGLANQKLGRATAAICWYQASLLSEPELPNKSDVANEISTLSAAADRKLKQAVSDANQLAENAPPQEQQMSFAAMSQINAATGNITKALTLCDKLDASQRSTVERSCWQLYARYATQIGDQTASDQANKWLSEHNAPPNISIEATAPSNLASELKTLDEDKSEASRRRAFSRLWQLEAADTEGGAAGDRGQGLQQLSNVIVEMSDQINKVKTIEKAYQSNEGSVAALQKLTSRAFTIADLSPGTSVPVAQATQPNLAASAQHLFPLAPLPKEFKVYVRTRNYNWGFKQRFRGTARWDHDNVYSIDWAFHGLPGIGAPWRVYVTGDHVQLVESRLSMRGAQTVLTGTIVGRRVSGGLHGQDLFTSWNGSWEAWW